jgi:hypothetical protein
MRERREVELQMKLLCLYVIEFDVDRLLVVDDDGVTKGRMRWRQELRRPQGLSGGVTCCYFWTGLSLKDL